MIWDRADGTHANPYMDPEECGLEPIAEIEYSDRCFQFDTRMVWREKNTGALFTARDSGCSCPVPFENYDSMSSLERLTNTDMLREEIREELIELLGWRPGGEQIAEEIAKVEAALRELRERS
jgi:hypothetical protein